jgi:hypothetical protein
MRTEENKKYAREYYLANKEKVLAEQKMYREKNKDRIAQYEREWRKKNAEKIAKKKSDWYFNNKDVRKEYLDKNKERFKEVRQIHNKKLKFKGYNITEEQYLEMFNNQNGCCVICGTPQNELKCALHIDHNHETGKIRGLLCMKCNRGIGYFNDNIEKMKNAIDYIIKNN